MFTLHKKSLLLTQSDSSISLQVHSPLSSPRPQEPNHEFENADHHDVQNNHDISCYTNIHQKDDQSSLSSISSHCHESFFSSRAGLGEHNLQQQDHDDKRRRTNSSSKKYIKNAPDVTDRIDTISISGKDNQGQEVIKEIVSFINDDQEMEENGTRKKLLSLLPSGRDEETPLSPISKQDHNLLDLKVQNTHETEIPAFKSLTRQLDNMKKEKSENLIQIAKLGTRLMTMEKKQKSLQKENKVLQKLLNTSRVIALNQSSLEQQEHHFDKEKSLCCCECQASTSAASVVKNKGEDISMDDMNKSFQSTIVVDEEGLHPTTLELVESLENELRLTREREARLIQQIKAMYALDNPHGKNDHVVTEKRDAFMESLLESQQEVVVYLRGEVDNLRKQLQQEQKKVASQAKTIQNTKEMIHVLERENQLVVAETIKNEKLLELVRQDLSIKAGENACLRDEVIELEQKSMEMQASERKLPSSKMCSEDHDNTSDAEETLMTVEIKGDNDINPEVQMLVEAKPSDQEVLLQKYQVLKRALKQKYQTKLQQLEEKLEKKAAQLDQLTHDLESQVLSCKKHQEELEQSEIRRMSNEIELNQEIEGLKSALRARETVVNALKVKMTRMQERSNGGGANNMTTWHTMAGISDALIEGVGRSIEIFEALSFVNDENDRGNDSDRDYTKSNMRHGPPNNLSSKSFG